MESNGKMKVRVEAKVEEIRIPIGFLGPTEKIELQTEGCSLSDLRLSFPSRSRTLRQPTGYICIEPARDLEVVAKIEQQTKQDIDVTVDFIVHSSHEDDQSLSSSMTSVSNTKL